MTKKAGFIEKVANKFRTMGSNDNSGLDRGLILFSNTSDVIKAERALRKESLEIKVKGPPPSVRTGCDLAIEFDLNAALKVAHVLSGYGIEPLSVIPIKDVLLEPVSLFQTKDYGEFLMVRAANMKITIRKADATIVNVSGGGCPDVPFLADQLVGKTLRDCPPPISIGQTLCGYALHLAYEELKRACRC
ncbi:MAG: DUF3343 domain-containing protein [Pseudomonadota bacterium]